MHPIYMYVISNNTIILGSIRQYTYEKHNKISIEYCRRILLKTDIRITKSIEAGLQDHLPRQKIQYKNDNKFSIGILKHQNAYVANE